MKVPQKKHQIQLLLLLVLLLDLGLVDMSFHLKNWPQLQITSSCQIRSAQGSFASVYYTVLINESLRNMIYSYQILIS